MWRKCGFLLARIGALLAAATCAAAAFEAVAIGRGAGLWRSPLASAGGLSAAGFAVALLGLALAHSRVWRLLFDRLTAAAEWLWTGGRGWNEDHQDSSRDIADSEGALAREPPANLSQPDAPRAGWVLIGAGLASFTLIAGLLIGSNTDPDAADQNAYLHTAREIARNGGPPALLSNLYCGRFAEANRHPLFLGLLSLSPEFEAGKLVSAAIGLLTLIACTWLVGRRFGVLTAGVFCVLLGTNGACLTTSSRVVSDGLLLLWAGLAWLHLVARTIPPFREGSCSSVSSGTLRGGAAIGLLLALAWLTKGTGLLLLAGVSGWFAWECVRRPRKRCVSALVCLLLVFTVVSSPLWVRNVGRYGQPFYNVNSLLLFADRFEQLAEFTAAGTTPSEAAREFFAMHSAADVVRREVSGLAWEAFIMLRTLGPLPLEDGRVVPGCVLAAFVLPGLLFVGRAARGLVIVWTALFWMVFAWYVPIAAGDRFVLPLLVPWLTCSAVGIVRIAAALRSSRIEKE